ncbi:MAG TPA: dUTP diphosphatase [Saprospiraceae bacterium]|nr:dUTP diphosphatase [Saprospiraceae bacterium]
MADKIVEIINKSRNALPEYKTELSAGMDLRADLDEVLTMKPLERMAIPTGLYIALPPNCEAQIRPRSGLALKQGITCLNTPGTIDADYRGEIQVILINLSNEIQRINPGERIAQMVVHSVEHIKWQQTDELDATERGSGGFGSTGKE